MFPVVLDTSDTHMAPKLHPLKEHLNKLVIVLGDSFPRGSLSGDRCRGKVGKGGKCQDTVNIIICFVVILCLRKTFENLKVP